MRKNSKKTNNEEEKVKKKTDTREMGQAHDQPGREHPAKRRARAETV
jgi:hypothetical protein